MAVGKGRDRGAGTLAVCCTEAAGLLGRDADEHRYVGQQTTRVPAPRSRPLSATVWSSLYSFDILTAKS
ncbi:hypothetical protein Y032_0676g1433 [Ancylostoma ceylanicum]|uniref:Uncharacterized protein n=1 Tax=Ancylostoma ceylanicum TaxID=53326 RepID=A0A016WH28_9BILA|nr:hypothetical protein Y032_0676g1433 [Ancylostoma ceylanicum]